MQICYSTKTGISKSEYGFIHVFMHRAAHLPGHWQCSWDPFPLHIYYAYYYLTYTYKWSLSSTCSLQPSSTWSLGKTPILDPYGLRFESCQVFFFWEYGSLYGLISPLLSSTWQECQTRKLRELRFAHGPSPHPFTKKKYLFPLTKPFLFLFGISIKETLGLILVEETIWKQNIETVTKLQKIR